MKPLVNILVDQKLAISKSEARRLVSQGAVRVNGQETLDVGASVADDANVERVTRTKWGQDALAGEEERELSGRFAKSTLCDCCSKSLGRLDDPENHFTDDEVCGSGDGPGFYLCGRKECGKLYDGKSVEERRALFTSGRARNEAKREKREHKPERPEKPFQPSNAQMFKVLDAFPVDGPVSHLIGVGMIASLLGISEEQATIVGNRLVSFGRFERLADNAWRRTL